MRILVYLGHPAHYHLFKNIISKLERKGHQAKILIKTKDILEQLCKENDIQFQNILPEGRKDNKFSMIIGLLKRDVRVAKIVKIFKPDILLSSDVSFAQVGWFLRIPAINFSEDDAEQVPEFAKLAFPFTSAILSPEVCSAWKWENKKIGYNSYQELAYLAPKYFLPDKNQIKKQIDLSKPYFIIRFSKLNAYHDEGRTGITDDITRQLIQILRDKGNIYITSEKELPAEFERFRIPINIRDMHHALYYANMYIGDSQTMTAEAAVLGTPAIRFNDFVGKLGYLEELEHRYALTFGIKTSEPEELYKKVEQLANMPNVKLEWQTRRKKMLSEKIDLTEFAVWFIENYPESFDTMKKEPEYQYNFKLKENNK